MLFIRNVYVARPLIEVWRLPLPKEVFVSAFRTLRPLLVDARQCKVSETVVTSSGFCDASSGDWIVRGENGETYVVDNAFFHRTFAPIPESPIGLSGEEGRLYGC
jgi:hypothetical protein